MEQQQAVEVLIVDDEDRFRITTTATLKKRGFRVKAVASGIEAIEEARNTEFDVVVLDVKMPSMDGHETLRRLKKLKPDVEVIMLTGYGSLDAALADRRQGVFAFLTKPYSIDSLAQRIWEAYAKRKGGYQYDRRVRDIMVPLSAFVSRISVNQSLAEAVEVVLLFFDNSRANLHESLHRAILVVNETGQVIGVLGFRDLLASLQQPPSTLFEKDSLMAPSLYLDAASCVGGFATMTRENASKPARELLPPKPSVIDETADLMEAMDKIFTLNVSSLLVLRKNIPVGVLREKDLFLEMAKIMREQQLEIPATPTQCTQTANAKS